MNSIRNYSILSHIFEYCIQISNTQKRFGDSLEQFLLDKDYQQSIMMSLIQIGELSIILTKDFKLKYNEIPWRSVKHLRNIAVHGYGKLEFDVVWKTIKEDIPVLKSFCQEIMIKLKKINPEDKPSSTPRP
ncbi:MAG: DUF86 domain-containing protein [Deltaproteobacteria bacterium]|jgi:uncharacterized protein with HEPN domain|nr:DUF86 domain-containing protein [Deltaproteobacteria bacterium]